MFFRTNGRWSHFSVIRYTQRAGDARILCGAAGGKGRERATPPLQDPRVKPGLPARSIVQSFTIIFSLFKRVFSKSPKVEKRSGDVWVDVGD